MKEIGAGDGDPQDRKLPINFNGSNQSGKRNKLNWGVDDDEDDTRCYGGLCSLIMPMLLVITVGACISFFYIMGSNLIYGIAPAKYTIGPYYSDGSCNIQYTRDRDPFTQYVVEYDENGTCYWKRFKNTQDAQEYIKRNTIVAQ